MNLSPLYRRYSGLLGALAFSGANFLLAFALQRWAAPFDFGMFALIQVMLQFGISVSNALFCAPAVVALPSAPDRSVLRSFLRANVAFCATAAVAVALTVWSICAMPGIAMAAGVLCFLSWMRWFLRSAELARSNFTSPARADVAYAVVVGLPAAWLWFRGSQDVEQALWLQATGCLAGFVTLREFALGELFGIGRTTLTPFLHSTRAHGGWALLGVVTTEATANAHAWIVGLCLGPAAFAPIAAMTLFYRPVLILTQSLTQYERPRMATAVRDKARESLHRHRSDFTKILLACLAANVVVVSMILLAAPRLVGNGQYTVSELWSLSFVIAMTYLARVLRGAESAVLQAGGRFRPLAVVTTWTAPISIALVAIFAMTPNPTSWLLMFGVLAGEVITCVLIRRKHRRFMETAWAVS